MLEEPENTMKNQTNTAKKLYRNSNYTHMQINTVMRWNTIGY